MGWRFKPPVERTRQGFRIQLDDEERELISSLLGELAGLLDRPDDPATARLFPTAYHRPEDHERDEEFQRLMREELIASRRAGIAIVEQALQRSADKGTVITEAEVLALAQALNGLRLVLGTVLDVGEDLDIEEIEPGHPLEAEHHLYTFLSWMLEWTVRALQG